MKSVVRSAVGSTARTRFAASGWIVAFLLIAFSASGLMAGAVTRQVGGFAVGGASGVPTSPGQVGGATAAAGGKFALSVQLAPNPAHVGQPVQLTVTAYTPGSAPVANVRCTPLQVATAPSFAPWPGALTTDASGQARWSLDLADHTAPGSYQVYVQGEGASYRGRWYGTLVVAG